MWIASGRGCWRASWGRTHAGRQLLDQLRGDGSRHAHQVARRVELHDVGADDGELRAAQDVEQLARRQAARLVMRDAGREGRVEDVEVEGDVDEALPGDQADTLRWMNRAVRWTVTSRGGRIRRLTWSCCASRSCSSRSATSSAAANSSGIRSNTGAESVVWAEYSSTSWRSATPASTD